MSEHFEYRVQGQRFNAFSDARAEAETIMSGLPDDDFVMIDRKDGGEDFFEPWKRIERDDDRFVLR